MADVTISQLPLAVSGNANNDVVPVSNGSNTFSLTLGAICGVMTSAQIVTALGFTPYNSTNPAGYITSSSLPNTQQLAKAWVNFDGTAGTTVGAEFQCTIRSQYNVSKVVRNTTGDYSVYFTTSFADANYCAQVTSGVNAVLASNAPSAPSHCIGTQAVGNIRVHTYNSNTGAATAQLVNRAIIAVTVWR